MGNIKHTLAMESGDLPKCRLQAKGFCSDQGGSDRGTANALVGTEGTAVSAEVVLQALRRGCVRPGDSRAQHLTFFSHALAVLGIPHIVYNSLEEAMKSYPA